MNRRRYQSGVTLIEMITVVALVGLIAAISFPAISSGLESIRLVSASDSISSFLNAGMNRAERRRQSMEITVAIDENHIALRSSEPGFVRRLEMPDGVQIMRVHPPLPGGDETARVFYLHPGGTIPRIGIEITNQRGGRRIIRVDPMTGVPRVEQPQ